MYEKINHELLKHKVGILELRLQILELGNKSDYKDDEYYDMLKADLKRELENKVKDYDNLTEVFEKVKEILN